VSVAKASYTAGMTKTKTAVTEAHYPRLTFRLNQETLDEITKVAKKQEVSSSKVIKDALEAHLKKHR
jgi:predicted DNA-binding protein